MHRAAAALAFGAALLVAAPPASAQTYKPLEGATPRPDVGNNTRLRHTQTYYHHGLRLIDLRPPERPAERPESAPPPSTPEPFVTLAPRAEIDAAATPRGRVDAEQLGRLEAPASLSVACDVPGATLIVRGTYHGPLTNDAIALDPGTHRIRVARYGYETYDAVHTLAPGETLALDVALRPLRAP